LFIYPAVTIRGSPVDLWLCSKGVGWNICAAHLRDHMRHLVRCTLSANSSVEKSENEHHDQTSMESSTDSRAYPSTNPLLAWPSHTRSGEAGFRRSSSKQSESGCASRMSPSKPVLFAGGLIPSRLEGALTGPHMGGTHPRTLVYPSCLSICSDQ